MKAVICSRLEGPEALTVGELPDPQPGPGQVVVEVQSAALNFPDALMVRGLYQVKPPLPFSPGAELAGVVRAVGEGVERPRVGDAVIGSLGPWRLRRALRGRCGAHDAAARRASTSMWARPSALTYGTALHALRDVRAPAAGRDARRAGRGGRHRHRGDRMRQGDGRARDRVRLERGEAGAVPRARRRRDDRLRDRGPARAARCDRRQEGHRRRLRRGRRPATRSRRCAPPAGAAACS